MKILQQPGTFLNRFCYDCPTHSEPALQYLIDVVDVDRVVLGTNWSADMVIDRPVGWMPGLPSLTQEKGSHPLEEH